MPKRHLLSQVALFALAILLAPLSLAEDDPGEALRLAASKGDLETVRKLLEAGADPNAANKYGATPLINATNKGHFEVVKLLVENGADVNQKDVFYGFAPIGAATFGDNEDIAVFMIENGLEDADGALPMAVNAGSVRMVEALLETGKVTDGALSNALLGAQRRAQADSESEEAAEAAKKAGEIVALLEKAGAKPPPPSEFQLPPEALARFEGSFVWPEQGFEVTLKLDDGALAVRFPNGEPVPVEPTDATTFRTLGGRGFKLFFEVENERVTGFRLEQQSGQTFDFVRKPAEGAVETAAAEEEEAEEVAAAEPETAIPPGAATRRWPAFRGPNAAGTAAGSPPLEWNAEDGENILWKADIPGRAHASPIIWDDRVFVATAVAAEDEGDFRHGLYGDVDSAEIKSDYSWRLYALDRKSGAVVWERTAAEGRPRSAHHIKATQANPTPVTDGEHVVAVMGSEGMYCYDFEGDLKWKKDLGTLDVGWFYDASYQWGHSSSPIIHDGKVIVQVDRHGDPFIAAYALADGEEIWRTKRDNMPSWGTPTLLEADGKAEIVTNGTEKVRAYDPKTGKELWSLGPNSEVTVGTPIAAHGLVYVTGGYPPVRPIYAVRPGGRGDISLAEGEESNDWVVWKHDTGGTYMPTPLAYGDYLYTLSNNGVLTCYDAKTGEQIYRERAAGKGGVAFTASPVAAAGRIYAASEDGDVYVVKAGPKFELLATNPLGEVVMATPAISGDVLFVRSLDHVFAIGAEASGEDAATSP